MRVRGLVLIAVFVALGLGGCAALDELKESATAWLGPGNSIAGQDGASELPGVVDKNALEKIAREKATKIPKKKLDTATGKPQQLEKVEAPNKRPLPRSAEAVGSQQQTDSASNLSHTAPARLRTPWPESPVSGSFSR
jgi:hypothetical protein